jgi:hypothetical protein
MNIFMSVIIPNAVGGFGIFPVCKKVFILYSVHWQRYCWWISFHDHSG